MQSVSEQQNNQEEKKKLRPWQRRFIMYGVAILVTVFYIYVLSDSNYNMRRKLDNKIAEYEAEIAKQQKNYEQQCTYESMQTDLNHKERFYREVLNMKKPNEDVFIIKE